MSGAVMVLVQTLVDESKNEWRCELRCGHVVTVHDFMGPNGWMECPEGCPGRERMTAARVEALLKRCEIRNPAFDVRLWRDDGMATRLLDNDDIEFRVLWYAPHRDTGEKVKIWSVGRIPAYCEDERALAIIEDKVREAFLHEFHKCWHIDGKRVREPHPEAA